MRLRPARIWPAAWIRGRTASAPRVVVEVPVAEVVVASRRHRHRLRRLLESTAPVVASHVVSGGVEWVERERRRGGVNKKSREADTWDPLSYT